MCRIPKHALIEGMYAEATLHLEKKNTALAVPLQAMDHEAAPSSSW